MARNSPVAPIGRDEAPRAPCSWEGCTSRAHLRAEIEPGKGMHNLCEFHYVEAHRKAAARRVREELGLETVEQMKEFCEEHELANSERRVSNAK